MGSCLQFKHSFLMFDVQFHSNINLNRIKKVLNLLSVPTGVSTHSRSPKQKRGLPTPAAVRGGLVVHQTSYNTNLTSKQPGRANSGLNLKPGEWETLFFLKHYRYYSPRFRSSQQSFMPEHPQARGAWGTWDVCSQSAA